MSAHLAEVFSGFAPTHVVVPTLIFPPHTVGGYPANIPHQAVDNERKNTQNRALRVIAVLGTALAFYLPRYVLASQIRAC